MTILVRSVVAWLILLIIVSCFINEIKVRQAAFIGHMRREGLEHLITTRLMQGRSDSGRQRERSIAWMDIKS